MTGSGKFIEVQGTAEGEAFSRDDLDAMLALAEKGIGELAAMQQATVAQPPAARPAER
jgi:ribonuclease PH